MPSLTNQDIIDGINYYKDIIDNGSLLVEKFSEGTCFAYQRQIPANSAGHIHAYPALMFNEALMVFMLPAEYDNAEGMDYLIDNGQLCPIMTAPQGSHRLDPWVAEARIEAWKDNYGAWIPEQVNTTYGMFMAFSIAAEDFEDDESVVYFALKEDENGALGYASDLVVDNVSKSRVNVYDDYVEPVPPFGGSVAVLQSFYLLTL